jgi:hypothetical protein
MKSRFYSEMRRQEIEFKQMGAIGRDPQLPEQRGIGTVPPLPKADSPENSDFASIQERIREWQEANLSANADQPSPADQAAGNPQVDSWLCPISYNLRLRENSRI